MSAHGTPGHHSHCVVCGFSIWLIFCLISWSLLCNVLQYLDRVKTAPHCTTLCLFSPHFLWLWMITNYIRWLDDEHKWQTRSLEIFRVLLTGSLKMILCDWVPLHKRCTWTWSVRRLHFLTLYHIPQESISWNRMDWYPPPSFNMLSAPIRIRTHVSSFNSELVGACQHSFL